MKQKDIVDSLTEQYIKRGMPKHCGECDNFELCSSADPEEVCMWLKASKFILSRFKASSFIFLFVTFIAVFGHWAGVSYAATPTLGTVTPSSGTVAPDTAKTLSCVYSDTTGWSHLKEAYLLVSSSSSALSKSAYLYYDQNSNKLYIRNDANTAWLGGYAPGSANVIENSFAKLNCASTTVTGSGTSMTVAFNVAFKPAYSGKTYNLYTSAKDDTSLVKAFPSKGTCSVNRAPALGTITPASGTGQANIAKNFITTFSDPDGWQAIQYVYFLINSSTSGLNCPHFYYNQNTNKLYIRNDANTAWLGGYAPGSANIIENSYAKLDCLNTVITGSGTSLTVTWAVAIKSAFTGTKNTYIYVRDDANAYVNLTKKGTWAILNNPPQLGSITPSFGASIPDTIFAITSVYSDPDGWQNIKYGYLLVSTASTVLTNCLYAYYDQNANKLYLRNDANTAWLGGYAPGATNMIENSYAKINCATTTVTGNGSDMTVGWSVSFKSAFQGAKNMYLKITDDGGASVNWAQKGTWTIDILPIVGTVAPSSGRGATGVYQNFVSTYFDSGGWQNIWYVNFLVNTQVSGADCLSAVYERTTNKLFIRDDSGTAWLGGYAPGSANTIENSYIKLDCSQITVFGSDTMLTVNWRVLFKSIFTGNKNIYLMVTNISNASSGVIQKGEWIINTPPAVDMVIPSSGTLQSGVPQIFTTIYSDVDGWQDLGIVKIVLNAQTNYVNSFSGYYDQNSDKLYMYDDAGAILLGGYAPGSSNTIENSYARLDCSKTSVSGSGNTLTVNWSVSFKPAFAGVKNIYLVAWDDFNALYWAQKGTHTIQLDTTLPRVTITDPADWSVFTD